jgi:TIR domain
VVPIDRRNQVFAVPNQPTESYRTAIALLKKFVHPPPPLVPIDPLLVIVVAGCDRLVAEGICTSDRGVEISHFWLSKLFVKIAQRLRFAFFDTGSGSGDLSEISNRHDQAIAEWIAGVLEAEGYTTVIQAWDFRPGGNFVLDMHHASANTKRTIAVLSPNYLRSEFTQPEWAAAFVQDPTGKERSLIPVRVEACELSGMLATIGYVDLVGKSEAEQQAELLRGVSEQPVTRGGGAQFPRLVIPQNLPIKNEVFVGRAEALAELHAQLQPGTQVSISSIKGMGGIGKTELALQYAYQRLKPKDYPGGICWLKAREDVGLQIVAFARRHLQLEIAEDVDLSEQVRRCWRD